MDTSRFSLIRNFSYGSLLAMLIAALLLGWMYRVIAIDELKNQGERYNLILARALSNAIWNQVKGVIDIVEPEKKFSAEEKRYSIMVLDSSVRELLVNTNVLKVKIHSKYGRVIYSTSADEIGLQDKNNYFSQPGEKQKDLLTRLVIENENNNPELTHERQVLESYLPIKNNQNNTEGYFEIYTDISAAYRHMEKSQLVFMLVLIVILGIVYLALFFVVRRADNVIHQQAKDREGYMYKIESINTDLDQYAKQLAKARDVALDASKAKSAFLANMSHELRTPLNAIIGYSDMLAEEMGQEGRSSDANDLNKIKTAGTHLLSIINDILDFSKIEAGRMELHLETTHVESLIHDVTETLTPMLLKAGNTLNVSVTENIETMFTDPTRVRQVLLNLLSNACKFTRNGTITLDVSRKPEDPGLIVFRVSDTGIGMSEEQLQYIFEAFKQADISTTRQFGGTGLGLTISRWICEMLGGEIHASSIKEQGSTFRITLPEYSIQPVNHDKSLENDETHGESVRFNNINPSKQERRNRVSRILVIDDDIAVSELIGRTLKIEGFNISVMNDPRLALETVSEQRPDVVLLDAMMPEVDGWTILKDIKNSESLNHVPVIMMAVLDNCATADFMGADGFIAKPINRNKLKQAVTECLRNLQEKPD